MSNTQKKLSPTIIGKRIRDLRTKSGMSQAEAAKKFKVSTSSYIKWENGARNMSDECKVRIANYYGLTVQEIFFQG